MISTTSRRPRSKRETARPDRRWLSAALLMLLGLGAATVSLLGPLVAGVIDYHVSEGAIDQVAGGDAAALFLVAPVSIAAAVLAMRRHRAAAAVALGPSIYALYMYTQLALGNDIGRYQGNSERFSPMFLAMVVIAGVITVRALAELTASELPALERSTRRRLGVFVLVVAFFLTFGLHLPGLVGVLTNEPPSEYVTDPIVFWLVKMMDLGFVVPFLLWTGTALLQQRRSAELFAFAGVGWTALLGSSVAGMAIVMQVNDDPAASVANTLTFGGFAVIALGFAYSTYRMLFAGR